MNKHKAAGGSDVAVEMNYTGPRRPSTPPATPAEMDKLLEKCLVKALAAVPDEALPTVPPVPIFNTWNRGIG